MKVMMIIAMYSGITSQIVTKNECINITKYYSKNTELVIKQNIRVHCIELNDEEPKNGNK